MSAEVIHEFGKGIISCAQLAEEGVVILDDTVVTSFKVVAEGVPKPEQQDLQLYGQLVVGLEGICITGQRGECPRRHNCDKVKITASAPPLFIEIEPLEVKGG